MGERKTENVMIHVEETIYLAMQKLLTIEQISASKYGRGLIIRDLRDRGVLTDEMLTSLVL